MVIGKTVLNVDHLSVKSKSSRSTESSAPAALPTAAAAARAALMPNALLCREGELLIALALALTGAPNAEPLLKQIKRT